MAKGSYLYSTDGKKYLDFVMGIAVNSLGHAHPSLIKTINDQSKKLWHVSNAFQIPEGENLAKKLCKKTFADYVMFQNSGAEATEAAIKVARRYFFQLVNQIKIEFYVLKIHSMEEHCCNLCKWIKENDRRIWLPKVKGFDHFNFGDHKTKIRKENYKKYCSYNG